MRLSEVFVESSAVVAWLIWEPEGPNVARILRPVKTRWISAIARPEAMRAVRRAIAEGRIEPKAGDRMQRTLDRFVEDCRIVTLDESVLERVGDAFPVEPVRTLDAIHLACWEVARRTAANLVLLSLDDRVRANARDLGGRVLP